MKTDMQTTEAQEVGTWDDGTSLKKAAVVAARAEKLTITGAAKAAGVGHSTVYRWRESDPEFARALDEARVAAVDELKENAYERAMKGDSLLTMFIIKAHDPEYNDKVQAARAMIAGIEASPALQSLTRFMARIEAREQPALPSPTVIEGRVIDTK